MLKQNVDTCRRSLHSLRTQMKGIHNKHRDVNVAAYAPFKTELMKNSIVI